MKFALSISAVLLAMLFGLTGCSSEREKAAETQLEIMDDLGDILAKIKSNSDIIDAKPKLEKIGARMKDQIQKMKALGSPSADEGKALETKYKAKAEKINAKLEEQMKRLMQDVGPQAIADIFQSLNVDLDDMKL